MVNKRIGIIILVVFIISFVFPTGKTVQAVSCIVMNENDSGTSSLRQLVGVSGCGTITFDPSLSGKTITLTSGQLAIDHNLVINGSALASPISISGNGSSRIFYVLNVSVSISVTLDSLILKSGYVSGSTPSRGGAIYNFENLTLKNMTFTDNHTNATQSEGGAIFNSTGVYLTIQNSTFINNSATSVWSYGGAIFNDTDGTVIVANSTFTGNSTGGNTTAEGGAINNKGNLYLTNSTLSANIASSDGGGGIMNRGYARLINTIVTGSSSSGGNCGTLGVPIDDDFSKKNLADDATCGSSFVSSSSINLGSLGFFGGKTRTIPLLVGSSAIDSGDNTACAAAVGASNYGAGGYDQRGVTRPVPVSGTCDIGAFEYDLVPQVTLSESSPLNGAVLSTGPSILTVKFNKDVLHDGDTFAANNSDNYLLVAAGGNDAFDTSSCASGLMTDDTNVIVNSVSYDSELTTATLTVNGGVPLPLGYYRLFVCGTTSITDFYGLKINNGLSDSTISFRVFAGSTSLPSTGFAPGVKTLLPPQSIANAYTSLGEIWLEIPDLNVKQPIIGVPATKNGWDITWLGNQAGWLEGTAFPTWAGNSVITGHVWNADNTPGIFINVDKLSWGDKVIVHAWGQEYIYEVRTITKQVHPEAVSLTLKHEEYPWITLVTCSDYDEKSESYRYRTIVKAVQITVK